MAYPEVFFDNHNVTNYVTSFTAGEIELDCPDLPAGQYMVTVVTEDGTSNKAIFTITEDLDPTEGFTRETYHVERANDRFLHQYKKPNGRS